MSNSLEDPTYDLAPRIVIWEMTRACALACRHCRAEAIPRRDQAELTTMEAFKLVDDVAACNRPLFVLTGGDPLMRNDISDAGTHDAFRGVRGSYQRTLEAVMHARDYGISVQINTTVAQHNRLRIAEFEELLAPLDIVLWSVFFVLPVGRAPAFGGKCGVCEFRRICGGSRARAFASSGDPFASDPACSYTPAAALSM